jgi:hypothetical protein
MIAVADADAIHPPRPMQDLRGALLLLLMMTMMIMLFLLHPSTEATAGSPRSTFVAVDDDDDYHAVFAPSIHRGHRRISEEHFWRNYFYRVSLIKQSLELANGQKAYTLSYNNNKSPY